MCTLTADRAPSKPLAHFCRRAASSPLPSRIFLRGCGSLEDRALRAERAPRPPSLDLRPTVAHSRAQMSSSKPVKASELLGKSKADLTKQLAELKEELLTLRSVPSRIQA